MACGTFGPGRLSEPEMIVSAALRTLSERERRAGRDLAGERILITSGATREEIDPVRFLSNRSSGRMGFALAEAARERGAEVTVVAGATSAQPPSEVRLLKVTSAEEMRDAVMREIEGMSIFIAAAAVSDYRPATRAPEKIKKAEARLTLTLEPTPDILSQVAEARVKAHPGSASPQNEMACGHARENLSEAPDASSPTTSRARAQVSTPTLISSRVHDTR